MDCPAVIAMLRQLLIVLKCLCLVNICITDGLVSGYKPGRYIFDKNPLSSINTQYVVARFCDKAPLWIQLWESSSNSTDKYRLVSETEIQPLIGNCSVEVVKLNETVTVHDNTMLGVMASSGAAFSCLYDPDYGDMRISDQLFPVAPAGDKVGQLEVDFVGVRFPYTVPLFFCTAEDCGESIDNLVVAENRSMIQVNGKPSKTFDFITTELYNISDLSTVGDRRPTLPRSDERLTPVGLTRVAAADNTEMVYPITSVISKFILSTLGEQSTVAPASSSRDRDETSAWTEIGLFHGITPDSTVVKTTVVFGSRPTDDVALTTVENTEVGRNTTTTLESRPTGLIANSSTYKNDGITTAEITASYTAAGKKHLTSRYNDDTITLGGKRSPSSAPITISTKHHTRRPPTPPNRFNIVNGDSMESAHSSLTGLLVWAIIASLLLLCILVAVTIHFINKMVEQRRFRGHHHDSYPVANDEETQGRELNDDDS